ncbi:MAG: hypothetical protein EBQ99_10555 [Planctomycetes bacterium]|nr:hypothetical protein [Planctomycetota bacterium]
MSDQLRDLRPQRGAGVQTAAADAAAGFRTDGDIPLPPMVAAFFVLGRRGREAMAEWSSATWPMQPPIA